jgi:hypothetical protein
MNGWRHDAQISEGNCILVLACKKQPWPDAVIGVNSLIQFKKETGHEK